MKKTLKTFASAALVLFAAASCQKTPADNGAVTVSFGSENYSFYLEDGPDYKIPFTVSGSNLNYPLTVTITDVASSDENVVYNKRNVDWRFIERRVVVNSADETPYVTVHCYNNKSKYNFRLGVEAVSNGTVSNSSETEITVDSKHFSVAGTYDVKGYFIGQTGADPEYGETWTIMAGADLEAIFGVGDAGYVGLTGLAGIDYTVNTADYYPLIGNSYIENDNGGEDFSVRTSYVLGIDNFVSYGYLTLPDYSAEEVFAVICPTVLYNTGSGTYIMSGYNLQLVKTGNAMKLDGIEYEGDILPYDNNSMCIAYLIYDYETGAFTGYNFGGMLYVDSIAPSAGAAAASAEPAATTLSAGSKAVVKDFENGEVSVVSYRPADVKIEKNLSKLVK